MKRSKSSRLFHVAAMIAAVAVLTAGVAFGGEWPTRKAIHMIIPFNAGGDSDFNGRTYARYLEKELKQKVVAVNISGAGGAIGAVQAKEAAPDGYTVFLADIALAINEAAGVSDFGYESFEIGDICGKNPGEFITVRKDMPVNTVTELIELTKREPDKYKLAANTGATTHYVASVLRKLGARFNVVNSGSSSERVAALAGKHIDVICNSYGTIKSYVDNGDFKVLASTASQRAELFPDIPTCTEQGVDLSYDMHYIMLFPKGTDTAIIEKFNAAVKAVSESTEYRDAIAKAYGQSPYYAEGDDALRLVKADRDRFMAFKEEFSTGK